MIITNPQTLLPSCLEIAREAGKLLLHYFQGDYSVSQKVDSSPLTTADKKAHKLLLKRLSALTPNIPVLSEESKPECHKGKHPWQDYWLIDPLDGTKHFIRRELDFTVNIALIRNNRPILGVVYAPALKLMYFATSGHGAFRIVKDKSKKSISVRKVRKKKITMITSTGHAKRLMKPFTTTLKKSGFKVRNKLAGSSIKICKVASGKADIYPRFGTTSEWDIAAAHCILEEAGGSMLSTAGRVIAFNKENTDNSWFIAFGDPSIPWISHAQNVIAKHN